MNEKDSENLHNLFWSVVEKHKLDYEDYGEVERQGGDCSCGCKWFQEMKELSCDWGVCTNKKSHRAGKLTFEHQGCLNFEEDPDEEDD